MKYIFWLFLAILLSGCSNNSEVAGLKLQVENLKIEKDSLIRLNENLITTLDSISGESGFWFSNTTEGKPLLDAGIKDPRAHIINSLKQQPELIPAEPVLGGQMRFTRVQLLGRDCLIAYYEDGHVAGRAIYSFVFKNGQVNFTLIRQCSG